MKGKLFWCGGGAEFFCRRGILSRRCTHAREHTVSLPRQGFNCQTAKATGTASDKNGWLHSYCSLKNCCLHGYFFLLSVHLTRHAWQRYMLFDLTRHQLEVSPG